MPTKITRAEFTLLAAGVALIVGSFAPFYSAPAGFSSPNAWDSGLSPIALYLLRRREKSDPEMCFRVDQRHSDALAL